MAKGFKMPSFSMPKPNINLGNVKMPNVNLEDLAKQAGVPEASSLSSAMSQSGVKMPTMDDIRNKAASGLDAVKNIKPSDVRDYAKNKWEEVKKINPADIIDNAKAKIDETKKSVTDMKQAMDDAGISLNFKGGDK